MPARGRARREPGKILKLTNGPSAFSILEHGRARLGTEGAETIVTYAKNCLSRNDENAGTIRKFCILEASWGPLGGVVGASWKHGCKKASCRPLGGLPGSSWDPQKHVIKPRAFEAEGKFVL